jgi:hypothetical protein
MTPDQKQRFKKLFAGIKENEADANSSLLNEVIRFDPNDHSGSREMPYDDFKKFLYVKDIPSVESNLTKLREKLINGDKYHYIHSYGKNGKSTFIRRFIDENKADFEFVKIDFKDFTFRTEEKKHCLITLTIKDFKFLSLSPEYSIKLVDTIKQCLLHINQQNFKPESSDIVTYKDSFKNIGYAILKFIDDIEKISRNVDKEKPTLFYDNFEKLITELNDQKSCAVELFNLLIFVYLKLKENENKKLVFIFDNIDDILTHGIEYITTTILPNISTFFTLLSEYLNLGADEFIKESIIQGARFVLAYRTANYVSSIFAASNISAKERRKELLSPQVYCFTAANSTCEIFRRKLDFYKELCDEFHMENSPNLVKYRNIMTCFERKDTDSTYISKLWNGNLFAFIECLIHIQEFDFLKHINYTGYTPALGYLKQGAFLYYTVKNYFTNNGHLGINSPLGSAFLYSFTKREGDMCNLLRLFLSYVINKNENDNKGRNRIENNEELFNRGVGLKDVLDELTKFKDDKGECVYKKKLFTEMFKTIFHDEVDTFDYFITCVRNNKITYQGRDFCGKKYDFSKELDIYFNPNISIQDKEKINFFKIYNNTNAKYYLNTVKKHYAFYSASLQSESHPLFCDIIIYEYKGSTSPNLFRDYNFTYGFNKYIVLNEVYRNVKQTTLKTVEFYIKSVYPVYPPKKYCGESGLALNSKFFYCDLISKHITYIEYVRQSFVNKYILFTCVGSIDMSDEKIYTDINAYFVYWIDRYILLFNQLYYKMADAVGGVDKLDRESVATWKSFDILKEYIEKIKNSRFTDFNTQITTDEKNEERNPD